MPEISHNRHQGGGADYLTPPSTMITLKKDYSGKTAIEWLVERKWTAFLMRVPLNKRKVYSVQDANDILSIRNIASMLNNNPNCHRKFAISANIDSKGFTITATQK